MTMKPTKAQIVQSDRWAMVLVHKSRKRLSYGDPLGRDDLKECDDAMAGLLGMLRDGVWDQGETARLHDYWMALYDTAIKPYGILARGSYR